MRDELIVENTSRPAELDSASLQIDPDPVPTGQDDGTLIMVASDGLKVDCEKHISSC